MSLPRRRLKRVLSGRTWWSLVRAPGQQEWGKQALQKAENFRKPMLWDADALNLLAINPDKRHNRILTPHPGEAARLLNCSVAEIESDRLLSAQRLVKTLRRCCRFERGGDRYRQRWCDGHR